MYKRTGFIFSARNENNSSNIKYLKKNTELSFETDKNNLSHKLIIGDNYDALKQLLINHRNKIDVIYIDPPYGCNSMGEFAKTNYSNEITRDNLLSMLYTRLQLAKQLLSEDGVIFCSIDDKNQAYIKCLFDEIFGEEKFLFVAPRITKKGGKSTDTIQKNHDYIIAYAMNSDIVFTQEEKNISTYNLEDEYVETRGKYKLTQTLDYNSLQYSKNMDYPIEINGKVFVPGGDMKLHEDRLNGNHGKTDWVWRWSKSAVEWGLTQGLIVVKGNRIYTKTYLNCRKKNGKNEFEYIDATKSYTTLSYLDNEYSNDNGKKELDKIFENSNTLFKNPKPTKLVETLIKMMCDNKNAIILDFFAGSGTTGQAVLELNKQDGGNRRFILCTNNEITSENPTGIAYDVTSKRLKRVMTGSCYNGFDNFKWIKDHDNYGDNLEVTEIKEISPTVSNKNNTPFDIIDETLYDILPFENKEDKISWICTHFQNTMKKIETDTEYINRWGE